MALVSTTVKKDSTLSIKKVSTQPKTTSTAKSLQQIASKAVVKSTSTLKTGQTAAKSATVQKTAATTKAAAKATTNTTASAGTKDLIKWGNFAFHADKNEIRGVKEITITASTDTEDKTADGETYVSVKNAGATEISMTAILDAYLGIDVKKETKAMLEAARKSQKGYFYAGKEKLLPYQFMLIKASAGSIILAPNGTWIHAEVSLNLKQCTKNDGTTAASSTGGGSGSGSATPAKQTLTESQKKAVDSAGKIAGLAGSFSAVLSTAGDSLKKAANTTLAAQAQSTIQSKVNAVSKKTTTTTTPKVTLKIAKPAINLKLIK